jgi:hypothetical protein
MFGPKLYMFRKQSSTGVSLRSLDDEKPEIVVQMSAQKATSRLKELNYVLEQKAAEEKTLLNSDSATRRK